MANFQIVTLQDDRDLATSKLFIGDNTISRREAQTVEGLLVGDNLIPKKEHKQ